MGIEKIRRWQWVVLSLVVGFLAVQVRRAVPQPLSRYGTELSDQKTFESAIVREHNGRRLFSDLVVYPVEVDEGGEKSLKHFVAGQYFNGKPRKEGGGWRAEWKPYCFVAPVPFKPMTQGEAEDPAQRVLRSFQGRRGDAAGPAGAPADAPSTAQALAAAGPGMVVDYLDRMRLEKGVSFTYAWWHHPRWERLTWVGGSFVAIGLVWPTFVNLMAFGALRRPAEEGAGLWEMLRAGRRRKRDAATAASAAAPPDLSDVERYDAGLAGRLAATAGPADSVAKIGADVPPAKAPPMHAPALSLAAAGASLVAAGPQPGHHYDAKPDDFYPTEKKRADDPH